MKRLILTALLCSFDMEPFPGGPQIGDVCECLAAQEMVVVGVAYGDDGSIAVYCASEVGHPALAQCAVTP